MNNPYKDIPYGLVFSDENKEEYIYTIMFPVNCLDLFFWFSSNKKSLRDVEIHKNKILVKK